MAALMQQHSVYILQSEFEYSNTKNVWQLSSLIWIKHNGSTEVHIYYSEPSALRWIIDMIQCLIFMQYNISK